MGLNDSYEPGDIVQVIVGPRTTLTGIVVEIKDAQKHIHVKLANGTICSYHPSSIEKIRGEKMIPENYDKVAVIPVGTQNCFFALYEDFQPGDSVLVSGVSEGKVLVISEVITPEEAKVRFGKTIQREVVCRVSYDSSAYEERVEKRKRLAELKVAMDKRVAELNEDQKYAMFIAVDDKMRKMYEEYKGLKGE